MMLGRDLVTQIAAQLSEVGVVSIGYDTATTVTTTASTTITTTASTITTTASTTVTTTTSTTVTTTASTTVTTTVTNTASTISIGNGGNASSTISVVGVKNIFKSEVKIMSGVRLDVEEIEHVLSRGLSFVLLSSAELLVTISCMYTLASQGQFTVFHVDLHQRQIHDDDNMIPINIATQTTGFCIFASNTPQEIEHFTYIAHLTALSLKRPVLHFFDGSQLVMEQPKKFADVVSGFITHEYEQYKASTTATTTPSPFLYNKTYTHTDPDTIESVIRSLSPSILGGGEQQQQSLYGLFEYSGPSAPQWVVVCLASVDLRPLKEAASQACAIDTVGFVRVRVLRPWSKKRFLESIPSTVTHMAILEQNSTQDQYPPLYLDVASSLLSQTSYKLYRITYPTLPSLSSLSNFLSLITTDQVPPIYIVERHHSTVSLVGVPLAPPTLKAVTPVEGAYLKLLGQVFTDRLSLVNARNYKSVWGDVEAPRCLDVVEGVEFGLGVLLERLRERRAFVGLVASVADGRGGGVSDELRKTLKKWTEDRDNPKLFDASAIISLLSAEKGGNETLSHIYSKRQLFAKQSWWLLGNDEWAFDLGASGIHALLASGENINLLLLDTQNYSETKTTAQHRYAKKNVGLYAMNYGNAYVASVAVYASYTQAYQAFVEADAFNGPSVILAYAPRSSVVGSTDETGAVKVVMAGGEEAVPLPHHQVVGPVDYSEAAITALKECKIAVDNGTWPLYRWNPKRADNNRFVLDSDKIKKDVEEFLKRDNQLALFVKEAMSEREQHQRGSLEEEMLDRQSKLRENLLESFARLNLGLNGPQMLVLYASDGGNAEGLAKRVFGEVSSLGARARCMAMNDFDIGELPNERNVVFVVSTAGQGEFPANGKEFWKQLCNCDFTLDDVSFSVFAMGDRNYWPRPEEAIYFCKAGRDLDAKLGTIGGNRLVECGIGDDQDADGFETGFLQWFPKVLKALELGTGEEPAGKKKVPSDEEIKKNSNYLRGTIAKSLEDTSTGSICYEDSKLTKFHGIYMQDDRDLREERRKQGIEKAFIFMARIRAPGGKCTTKQWLKLDELSDKYCNSTIKITTRQTIQYHGILKKNLKRTICEVNQALMDTIAACGDVNRNVMCNPNPYQSKAHTLVYEFAKKLSEHLTPHTSAYHEIWVDKKPVAGNAVQDFEPLYGETYLPRKFKIAIAIPPHNDVDIYCHDLGYIAVISEDTGDLLGFNVSLGGGMGMTHNNPKTYPCLGQLLAFCKLDQAIDVGEKVMLVQRDNGSRTNRKHARLKYTLEDHGLEWFLQQIEERLGYKLEKPHPTKAFTSNGDTYGWVQGTDDLWYMTVFVEHGRVKDTQDYLLRTGLRDIAKTHEGDFRFSPNQNLIISGVQTHKKEMIEELLRKYNINNGRWSVLRLNSMACTALPTCGLAFAESERYLPRLVTLLEKTIEECGLSSEAIHIRMSGCPNGCSRPWVGEIAMVGRSPGIYNLYLGGGFAGERLNKLYREALNEEGLLNEIRPLIIRFAKEKREKEHFGDFVVRAGIIAATTAGQNFHAK